MTDFTFAPLTDPAQKIADRAADILSEPHATPYCGGCGQSHQAILDLATKAQQDATALAAVRAQLAIWKTESAARGADDTLFTNGVVTLLEKALGEGDSDDYADDNPLTAPVEAPVNPRLYADPDCGRCHGSGTTHDTHEPGMSEPALCGCVTDDPNEAAQRGSIEVQQP